MVKQLLPAFVFAVIFSSCTALKSLNFTSSKQVAPVSAPVIKTKFIDNITMTPAVSAEKLRQNLNPFWLLTSRWFKHCRYTRSATTGTLQVPQAQVSELSEILAARSSGIEMASSVQLKYAILLQTEVEALPAKNFWKVWITGMVYATAAVVMQRPVWIVPALLFAVYSAVYGMALPRISRDQYRISRKISTTELQEGDLVFFNTTGRGVSHVGVYLGNNRFAHASVSRGVMVSSLWRTTTFSVM